MRAATEVRIEVERSSIQPSPNGRPASRTTIRKITREREVMTDIDHLRAGDVRPGMSVLVGSDPEPWSVIGPRPAEKGQVKAGTFWLHRNVSGAYESTSAHCTEMKATRS